MMNTFTEKSTLRQVRSVASKPARKLMRRECNLCGHKFRPHSKYERFCDACRAHSETFHYGEWMIPA